jgi:hypothetical protein
MMTLSVLAHLRLRDGRGEVRRLRRGRALIPNHHLFVLDLGGRFILDFSSSSSSSCWTFPFPPSPPPVSLAIHVCRQVEKEETVVDDDGNINNDDDVGNINDGNNDDDDGNFNNDDDVLGAETKEGVIRRAMRKAAAMVKTKTEINMENLCSKKRYGKSICSKKYGKFM